MKKLFIFGCLATITLIGLNEYSKYIYLKNRYERVTRYMTNNQRFQNLKNTKHLTNADISKLTKIPVSILNRFDNNQIKMTNETYNKIQYALLNK